MLIFLRSMLYCEPVPPTLSHFCDAYGFVTLNQPTGAQSAEERSEGGIREIPIDISRQYCGCEYLFMCLQNSNEIDFLTWDGRVLTSNVFV